MGAVTRFRTDEDGHWVAELDCGCSRHVRHDPPWQLRAWVTSEEGRRAHLGMHLVCACEEAAGRAPRPSPRQS
jgi:hypothetical protein